MIFEIGITNNHNLDYVALATFLTSSTSRHTRTFTPKRFWFYSTETGQIQSDHLDTFDFQGEKENENIDWITRENRGSEIHSQTHAFTRIDAKKRPFLSNLFMRRVSDHSIHNSNSSTHVSSSQHLKMANNGMVSNFNTTKNVKSFANSDGFDIPDIRVSVNRKREELTIPLNQNQSSDATSNLLKRSTFWIDVCDVTSSEMQTLSNVT